MNLYKSFCVVLLLLLFTAGFAETSFSQERTRIIPNPPTQTPPPITKNPPTEITQKSRPLLNNQLTIQKPLVKKTGSSQPINAPAITYIKKTGSSQPINAPANGYISKNSYNQGFSQRLLASIQNKFGIPYRYGSDGPNTYDCSGLVWSVFKEAGYYFDRTSARSLWQQSEAVEGDDRFKFGTLIFFNKLGHMGIVADDEGFYHASSSKGVTYSKFEGYWAKRIVGFRRLSISTTPTQPLSEIRINLNLK